MKIKGILTTLILTLFFLLFKSAHAQEIEKNINQSGLKMLDSAYGSKILKVQSDFKKSVEILKANKALNETDRSSRQKELAEVRDKRMQAIMLALKVRRIDSSTIQKKYLTH